MDTKSNRWTHYHGTGDHSVIDWALANQEMMDFSICEENDFSDHVELSTSVSKTKLCRKKEDHISEQQVNDIYENGNGYKVNFEDRATFY